MVTRPPRNTRTVVVTREIIRTHMLVYKYAKAYGVVVMRMQRLSYALFYVGLTVSIVSIQMIAGSKEARVMKIIGSGLSVPASGAS